MYVCIYIYITTCFLFVNIKRTIKIGLLGHWYFDLCYDNLLTYFHYTLDYNNYIHVQAGMFRSE
jgi:hypothetical protein